MPEPPPAGAAGADTAASAHRFEIRWARCEEEVREAQRLRYRVFSGEMGACLPLAGDAGPGLDADRFDPFCEHLLVWAAGPGELQPGLLVGTYRVLAPDGARRAGGLYADTEFDTRALKPLLPHAVELGRSCVHPEWRSGAAIMAMWSALCQYMVAQRLDTMLGCASVALDDGGSTARQLWGRLRQTHLVDSRWRVHPFRAFPVGGTASPGDATATAVPPLIKGYLRCGARLLGPPAHDESFNTADLPMMLHIDHFAQRYRNRFLGG